MRDEHILDILDAKSFGELTVDEKKVIDFHAAQCAGCRKSFEAARLSALLLKSGAENSFVPPAFFQTRVLANLREKQLKISPLFAFARIWRASGTLVVMMLTTVAVLIALTVFAPNYGKVSGASLSDSDADVVILDGKMPVKEPSNEQVFQIVYGDDSTAEK